MLGLFVVRLSSSNSFLIRLHNGYCLVDCGSRSDLDLLKASLFKVGVLLSELAFLVLTHHHRDHCGLLSVLLKENPGIRIVMSKTCANYVTTGGNCVHADKVYASMLLGKVIAPYMRLHKSMLKNGDPYFARAGDILIDEDIDFNRYIAGSRLLTTPGHTHDSISLIIENTAFVGDAARNVLNYAGKPYLPILLYDVNTCYKSWRKITESGVNTIYPAHGKPFDADYLLRYRSDAR